MTLPNWWIYGANGYTGELIAREAVRRGMKPILAGRNRAAVSALAAELHLDSHCFALDDPKAIKLSTKFCPPLRACAK